LIGTFRGHKGAVWSAKVDKRSRTLAVTASGDFSSKLWCASTGRELFDFKHKHIVRSVDFSASSERIATGCQDGLLRIFDTCSPEKPPNSIQVSASGMDEAIIKLAWAPDSENFVLLGKRSGKVEMWDIRTSSTSPCTMTSQLSSNASVMDMEVNPSHSKILVACDNKVITLSMSDLQVEREFVMPSPMHFREEGGASLSADGTKFIAGGSDLWLREFDSSTGAVLRTLKGHHGPIRCVRYHPNGVMAATGSEDATIRIWDLSNSNCDD